MNDSFDANEILPHLFLGSYFAAKDITALKKYGITHIVSMPIGIKLHYKHDFTYLRFKTYDANEQDLISYFDLVADFIDIVIKNNGTVLVHCMKGKSRSATMVAAYMIRSQGLSVENAVNIIQSKRPIAKPNDGFLAQLKEYEQLLKENFQLMPRRMKKQKKHPIILEKQPTWS